MTEKQARALLMDYLYDEISAADQKKIESYLAEHPGLQQELNELRDTRSMLRQAPEVVPDQKLQVVGTKRRSFADWWQDVQKVLPRSGWAKAALASAACLVLLLVTGAVVDLHIQSTETGFSISFGKTIQPQTATLTDAQTETIVQKIKKENAAILTEYAKMLNRHNKQQLQQVVQYFQNKRERDLKHIQQNLKQVHLKGQYRWAQTNQMLSEIIQTASVKQ